MFLNFWEHRLILLFQLLHALLVDLVSSLVSRHVLSSSFLCFISFQLLTICIKNELILSSFRTSSFLQLLLLLLLNLISALVERLSLSSLLWIIWVYYDAVSGPPWVAPAGSKLARAQWRFLKDVINVRLGRSETQALQIPDGILILDDLDEVLVQLVRRTLTSLKRNGDHHIICLVPFIFAKACQMILSSLSHKLFIESYTTFLFIITHFVLKLVLRLYS